MSALTLTLDAAFATVTAALFSYVGWITGARRVDAADGRRATRRFAVWWFGLAAVTLAGALNEALAAAGDVDVQTHRVLGDLAILPLVLALWGLVSYLAYIYAGSRKVFAPVTAFHVLVLGLLAGLVAYLTPTGLTTNDWGVQVQYEQTVSGPLLALVILVILVPALAAAALYGTLYFRTTDRTARYRIGMTSGAFLLWFGVAALATPTGLSGWYWYPLVSRAVGLVATLMVILAYRPPRALRERYGVAAVELATRDAAADERRRARPIVAPSA
jgi:hypothetical protein